MNSVSQEAQTQMADLVNRVGLGDGAFNNSVSALTQLPTINLLDTKYSHFLKTRTMKFGGETRARLRAKIAAKAVSS